MEKFKPSLFQIDHAVFIKSKKSTIDTKTTVIVPNYNHEKFLEKRLESIFIQSNKEFEVILMDDNSSDNSKLILEKFSKHPHVSHFLINKKNSGSPFKQWLKGIQLAKGEYIWIAESDDWADPRFLEKMIAILESDPKLGIVSCRSEFVDENGMAILDKSIYRETFRRAGKEELLESMAYRNSIHNASSVVFRKKFVPENIDHILNMRYCGDWIFWAEILKKSDFYFLNEKLNFFRRHPNNVSFSAEKSSLRLIEGIHICKTIFSLPDISETKKKAILSFWWKKVLSTRLNEKSKLKTRLKKIALLKLLFQCSPRIALTLSLKTILNYFPIFK